MKKHRFLVTVTTTKTKARARAAILCAFAVRQPDGCKFHTTEFRRPRQTTLAALVKACRDRLPDGQRLKIDDELRDAWRKMTGK